MTTAWPRVVAACADLGVEFDPWQHGVGSIALGKRADGKYAATVGGIVLSIPRQVGKTFLVGMIVIALCLLNPGLTVLWTAHRTRTATKTFFTLKAMTGRKKIAPHMLDPRMTNGEQEIRFRNGSTIMFGAREQGFGRGFDEVDVAIFDEAQILTAKGLEDIVPATNQSRQEAGALLFFMGTPPRATDPGEEFTNRRKRALSGKSKDMVYVEFSADEDADPDDHKQWSKANPSFPKHTPVESIERMRENLTDLQSFMHEGLGVWDPETVPGAFSLAEWAALAGKADPSGSLILGVDVSPLHASASISVTDGRDCELIDRRPGTEWLLDRLVELRDKHQPTAIAYDTGGPIGSMIPDLTRGGLNLTPVHGQDVTRAWGALIRLVKEADIRHRGEPEYAASVAGLRLRAVGDGHKASRKDSTVDISPLASLTVALWVFLRDSHRIYDPLDSVL